MRRIALLAAAAFLWQAGPCRTEGNPDASCGEAEQLDSWDGRSLQVSFLQSGLLVGSPRDLLRPSPALVQLNAKDGLHRSRRFPSCYYLTLKTVFVLVLPFALLQIIVTWPLAAWLVLGRRKMLSDILTRESEHQAHHEAPSTRKPENQPKADVQVPSAEAAPVVSWFLFVGTMLININFTIVLPSSHIAVSQAGGSTFVSGLTIGAYALGSLVGLPFVIRFSRYSYRGGLLFMAASAVAGNTLYAILGCLPPGRLTIGGMILARMICGMEGGLVIMFAAVLAQLSGGSAIARNAAWLTFFGSLGLMLGPGLSSLSETCFPQSPPQIPPAVLAACLAGLYGIFVLFLFPSQYEVLRSMSKLGYRRAGGAQTQQRSSAVALRRSWLCLAIMCVVIAVKAFQRVAWEAGIAIVLVQDYGYSVEAAGYLTALTVMGSLPVAWFSRSLTNLSQQHAFRLLSLMECVGMVLMLRFGPSDSPTTLNAVIFLLGSSIFYGANFVSVVPLAPVHARFALRGHWLLSVEASAVVVWAASCLGSFYGPVAVRAILDCATQNLLPVSMIVVWLGWCVAVEVPLYVLLQEEEEDVTDGAKPQEAKAAEAAGRPRRPSGPRPAVPAPALSPSGL